MNDVHDKRLHQYLQNRLYKHNVDENLSVLLCLALVHDIQYLRYVRLNLKFYELEYQVYKMIQFTHAHMIVVVGSACE